MFENLDLIKQQFTDVIKYSQEFTPNQDVITQIFDMWARQKSYLIREFLHNQLIYEYGPVELHLDVEKKSTMFEDFLNQLGDMILDDKVRLSVIEFLNINAEGFFSNIVTNVTDNMPADIKSGMKLIRCLKFFIKTPELLVQIQQLASSYIQRDKVKGILCFSVHPLDYLSSSENTYNWRSCHALDGDYRAGNLSYMCDNSTIVCYLKGENEVQIPQFPDNVLWNSKKWRMLLFMDNARMHCFLGRQYPFTVEGILPIIQKDFLSNDWVGFSNKYINAVYDPMIGRASCNYNIGLSDRYVPLYTYKGYELLPMNDIIEDGSDLHYNDLLLSSYYKNPYYNNNVMAGFSNYRHVKIRIGAEVPCLCCGKRPIRGGGAAIMVCEDCDNELMLSTNYQICDVCGERIYENEDFVVTERGEIVCMNCVDNGEVVYCDNCEAWFMASETVYDEKQEKCYCLSCADECMEEK